MKAAEKEYEERGDSFWSKKHISRQRPQFSYK
jgi:hypothetical protein